MVSYHDKPQLSAKWKDRADSSAMAEKGPEYWLQLAEDVPKSEC